MPLLALAAALALAAPGAPIIRPSNIGKTMPLPDDGTRGPILSIPFLATGPLIEEDANTVSHVYWNGSALVDTKGNSWTMNGTVPQNVASPFYPDGFAGAQKKGAGPYSAANNYSLGTGSDVLDITGDFTVCAVVDLPLLAAAGGRIIGNGIFGATGSGWLLAINVSGGMPSAQFDTYAAGSAFTRATQTLTARGATNIVCGGRSGTTQYASVSSLTGSSAVGSKQIAGTGAAARIGEDSVAGGGNHFASGAIYEIYITSTPFSNTLIAGIFARVFGQVTSTGTPLTVTRSSAATYEVGGTLWTAPAGALRVNSDGALIEASATNYALNSGTHPKTTEASASVTTGAAVAWHAGTGTMTLAAGTATVTGLSCTAVAAGTPCTFTVTVAGTMSITTTAGTTRVQIENSSVPTSYIATTTTAATRQADVVSVASPFATVPTAICQRFDFAQPNVPVSGCASSQCRLGFNSHSSSPADSSFWVVTDATLPGTYFASATRNGTRATLTLGSTPDTANHSLEVEHVSPARVKWDSTYGALGAVQALVNTPGVLTINGLNATAGYTAPWTRAKNLKLYNVPCSKAR